MTLAYCNHCGLDHRIEDVFVRENDENICTNCFEEWIEASRKLQEIAEWAEKHAMEQEELKHFVLEDRVVRTEEDELPF